MVGQGRCRAPANCKIVRSLRHRQGLFRCAFLVARARAMASREKFVRDPRIINLQLVAGRSGTFASYTVEKLSHFYVRLRVARRLNFTAHCILN